MVTIILTALFFTALGQMIVQWYYVYICFVGETKIRMDTFIISVDGNPIASVVSLLMSGIGQILTDALLVTIELSLTTVLS